MILANERIIITVMMKKDWKFESSNVLENTFMKKAVVLNNFIQQNNWYHVKAMIIAVSMRSVGRSQNMSINQSFFINITSTKTYEVCLTRLLNCLKYPHFLSMIWKISKAYMYTVSEQTTIFEMSSRFPCGMIEP